MLPRLPAGDSMPAAAMYSVDVGMHCTWTPQAKALVAWLSITADRARCSPIRDEEHAVSTREISVRVQSTHGKTVPQDVTALFRDHTRHASDMFALEKGGHPLSTIRIRRKSALQAGCSECLRRTNADARPAEAEGEGQATARQRWRACCCVEASCRGVPLQQAFVA